MSGKRPTQAVMLVDLAKTAALFHALDGTGFADINIKGHRETWPIDSGGFKEWLRFSYFRQGGGAPTPKPCSQQWV